MTQKAQDEKFCTECGSIIKTIATACTACGVRQMKKPASLNLKSMNRGEHEKSRGTAMLLAFLLGFLGGHKFYLNRPGQGILYLVLCWTLIPGCIALIEVILFWTMSEATFHKKYG